MRKIFSSILIGLLLTANVSFGAVVKPESPVAECVDLVMPSFYKPGITAVDLMVLVAEQCGEELKFELEEGGYDSQDDMTVAAACLYYSTEWLNRVLQIMLDKTAKDNPKAKA